MMRVLQSPNQNAAIGAPSPQKATFMTPDKQTARKALLSAEMEMQVNSKWIPVRVQLFAASVVLSAPESSTKVVFEPETRVTIPMRNLRSESRFKGCAFQIENAGETHILMAASLPEKNAWARKLNIVLGELRKSGAYETSESENILSPFGASPAPMPKSVDRQQRQRAAVQQLAQSLQPRRTQARTPAGMTTGMPDIDRSGEMSLLRDAIAQREALLKDREEELEKTRGQLQREQQYREQIAAGVERWRAEQNDARDRKLADTRERLDEESARVRELEKEKLAWREQNARVAELEEHVQKLEAEGSSKLRDEIADLRDRLEKETAFVAVLEHDTRQMAAELTSLSAQHTELKERAERERQRAAEERDNLCASIRQHEDETLELKRELGVLRQDNKRLQEAQNSMHREFFFSLALSIKLSLAQQGIYSNADLNLLYEHVLSEPYSNWTSAIERKLVESQMTVESKPVATPRKQQPTTASTPASKKKGFLGGFFN